MVGGQCWLWLWLLCLGCHSLLPVDSAEDVQGAEQLRQQGQAAMRRGEPDEAIRCYSESLAADPGRAESHLGLAGAYLEKKDPGAACVHLAINVDAHPEQLVVRARYAELLARLHRSQEARNEFEQFIAAAQEQRGPAAKRLIDCHSRLAEMAEE